MDKDLKGTNKLIADLEAKPPSRARDSLIARARSNSYHDFRSQSATPKVDLLNALSGAGFADLAMRAVDGDYDDAPGEEDLADLRAVIGDKAFDQLTRTKR